MVMLFDYPKSAEFGRIVPKSKIYERSKPSFRLRERFISEVGQIVWKYKLAPETINLPPRGSVNEIQVFSVSARTGELSDDVLRCIDKAIPSPIIYEISFEDKLRMVTAYKRPSEASPNAWVISLYFASRWMDLDALRQPLPVVLDMGSLYENIVRTLIDVKQSDDETLKQLVERISRIREKEVELAKLNTNLSIEKQFNRRVELNSKVREVQSELYRLSNMQKKG